MKLLILDGNSVVNRAFYGVRPLTTKDGLFTNAIYGFLNILEKMEKEEQPDAVCVAFDLRGPTFRHMLYNKYKANRHGMPEELAQQMPILKDVLRAMNIPIYETPSWEADDIIGTVGNVCNGYGWECVIVTGDRDSLQLINNSVSVKLVITKGGTTTAELYDDARFREEYGFEPKKLVDLKALMGDSSDNIPGVGGIGPKTATELIVNYGSLEGVYENLDDPKIRPKVREKLVADKENAFLSYNLAKIEPNAPITFTPMDALIQPYNKEALFNLFAKLEFIKLIDRYDLRDAGIRAPKTSKKFDNSTKPLCDKLNDEGDCSIYFAEDGSVGMANKQGVCVLTPLEAQAGFKLPNGSHVCHDMKLTMHKLDAMGITWHDFNFDTALAAYIINPSQSDYSLSKLATKYLGITLDENDPAACAEALWNLRPLMVDDLICRDILSLYEQIEMPLCHILYDMECEGVAIDREQLEQFGKMLSARIADCETLIFQYSGAPFNINSTRQLGELLFEKLGLPPVKKTKTGYSTNADVLQKLKEKHPIIPAIMDYRMLTKLKSTYADGLLKVIDDDGRIRTTFQNMVTATGRLSSTEPNLQNIPIRTDLGAEIRKMFIPRPGCVLVDADYSQIELRVLAHIANDDAMRRAFKEGLDIHAVTASQVFGVPIEEVTPLQRRHAKAVNFGIVYGISEFSLAEDIGVSRYEAKAYIDSYLDKYQGVRRYMTNVVEEARQRGYTETMFCRRRYIPELTSSNFNIRQGAERIALNTPIQGTAADLIKIAMKFVHDALREQYPQAKMILQVHDELIVECPEEIAEEVAQLVSSKMESVAFMSVPLIAEAKWGRSWYEAK